ncbi:MAG: HAMP domain-containing protein [Deltaproteobacteria bacterium]|nr:HAMP domain-containing protein [Deltaproteobacteria bacterium]
MARVALPRDIHAYGEKTLSYLVVSLIIVGLVSIIIVAGWIDLVVLRRLSRLRDRVIAIGGRGGFRERLPVSGHDELDDVSRGLNQMLDGLEAAHENLEFEQRQMVSMFESIDESIYVADPGNLRGALRQRADEKHSRARYRGGKMLQRRFKAPTNRARSAPIP